MSIGDGPSQSPRSQTFIDIPKQEGFNPTLLASHFSNFLSSLPRKPVKYNPTSRASSFHAPLLIFIIAE